MSRLTQEQVLALAPDSSSAAAGRDLSNPAKWESSGHNEIAVWGEARGSGARPYQTAVDLREPAFKCSCPSRKFPCKHGLGLLLRYAKEQVQSGSPPGWVSEWIEKRDEKSAKTPVATSEPDAESIAKRAEKRKTNILTGLDECEAFLKDVASTGLLAAQTARTWDQMAARMVDAQAPGIARRLKRIGASIGVGPDWAIAAVSAMGNLQLLIEAGRRMQTFTDLTRTDILTALGVPTKKDALPEEPVIDVWDIVGQQTETEDRLTTCRSWLLGRTEGKWAMHLAFSVAGQPFDVRLLPGTALAAELRFFPSAWPLRADLGERDFVPFRARRGRDWAEALCRVSSGLASCPWVEQFPIHLTGSCLGRSGSNWYAIDRNGESMPLTGHAQPLELLALTGNEPCELFGEWDGHSLRLLSGWGAWGFLRI